jgi:CRISPR-associated endonuclease/helicase Cas3
MSHKDFMSCLSLIAEWFSLPTPPTFTAAKLTLGETGDLIAEVTRWKVKAARIWDKFKRTPHARLVPVAKSCLIAADVAGSALPKSRPTDPCRWSWIDDSFADRPKLGDLQSVADYRLAPNKPREFQSAVAASTKRVTYVKAGCGTGKTVAAYMWAARNYPTRRLYFCYPTTGTATEGFRDYLFDEAEKTPRVEADLFHGRSDVDFELILNTGRDDDPADEARRLESLRAWKTPVVACTVDTVLGLVQNNRRGLFAWPALAQSAFVFDEIHAFDDRLFGALLRFLRDLPGLPVLLTTASLPKAREDALREVVGSLDPISGPADLEERPRYHKAGLERNDPLPLVNAALDAAGKVLWICNTVGRVMATADRLAARNALIYHSRFKYEDRVRRHADVIDAFKGDGPAVAVCSQVAEMSLDMSADLLVTDLAPVPALIQRLGRLNRCATAGDPTKPFAVVEPENPLPYTDSDLERSRGWFAKLASDEISQRHLADAWEQEGDHPPEMIGSAWLDGGPTTIVKELREGSPGITVLMQEDVARVNAKPKDLPRLILPMPSYKGWEQWKRERGLPIAPRGAIIYEAKRGAEWI